MKKLVLVLAAGLLPELVHAQDQRDEDIFGEGAKPTQAPTDEKKDAGTPPPSTLDRQAKALMDTMQIGGRLEVRSTSSQAERQTFQEGSFTPSKTADIYFDTRPSEEIRVFLRTRLSEQETVIPNTSTGETTRVTTLRQDIDELWFKWDLARSVFVTYGKQHLKWGSGQIWNPTDFTAREVKDPFDLFDRRLGQNLLKIHIPNEKMGFNYYAVVQFDDAERNDDLGLALRGEFAFLGTGELALTAQARRNAPQRLGVDVSSALGPIDVNVEAALTKRQKRTFFRDGVLEDEQIVLPTPYQDEDKTFKQVASGIRYAVKYSDDDSIYFGAEYFYNELGYEERFPELYSFFLRESPYLYSGRRYVSGYVRLPNPGDWNKTSFYLTGLGNLSDKTSIARLTGTWLVANYATFEAWAQRCFGEYGELCLKIPENLKEYGATVDLPDELQNALALMPTEKTYFTAGVGLSINF
ncbi:MAG TPA: hypothetical protein VFO10_24395 [Oligoflexus sp.]|uniref:hypothetical protein n=1 Tax=Oligoflexus sp. TaxID=1971216 RepID=UPI002D7FE791|nr:hypothetical protein [Oligoflexus sp.]HET9240427.1 hypothetical protein [Oligoflexus sp.]